MIFEVVDGNPGGESDVVVVGHQFGGVRALDPNEQVALEPYRR